MAKKEIRASEGNLEKTAQEKQQQDKAKKERAYIDYIISWRAGAIANGHGAGAAYQQANLYPAQA